MQSRNIYTIIGPTASSKSKIAIKLADKYPFEIISLDSSMIYREMNIGTDKPNSQILSKHKHHLIDIINPTENYNVSNYCNDVEDAISIIYKKNKTPLIVGGTMMYFNALVNGLDEIPRTSLKDKKFVNNLFEIYSCNSLYECLKEIDYNSYERINANDKQRIERAIGVYISTGRSLSSFFKSTNNFFNQFNFINIKLFSKNRQYIHENIRKRTIKMIKTGLIEEVDNLVNKYPGISHSQSMKAIGYKQTIEYLNGIGSKEELIDKCIFATRQLAKRQLTWMKSFKYDCEIDISPPNNIIQEIEKNLHLEKLM